MEPSPWTPRLWRAFERQQEHNLKHPALMDLIPTKQNKTKQNKKTKPTNFLH
jgi:hypothetical protein